MYLYKKILFYIVPYNMQLNLRKIKNIKRIFLKRLPKFYTYISFLNPRKIFKYCI